MRGTLAGCGARLPVRAHWRRFALPSLTSPPRQQNLKLNSGTHSSPTPSRCSTASLSVQRGARSMQTPLRATAEVADAAGTATSSGSAKAPSSNDLLVVGPGVLGSYLGKLWLEQYPGATVVGQTNSDANHGRLRALGLQPRTKAEAGDRRFPFVVFSAPPSGSEDYPAEIRAAAQLWDGTGTLLFTGSAGLFTVDDGSQCNEDSPIAPLGVSERNDRLINGEQAVLELGGNVVRLVGLYHSGRGAHTFFLRTGQVPRWGGYTVNLIHYEDAAGLSAAILRGDGSDSYYRSKVFLGTDGTPITFTDMMAAVEASGAFKGHAEFTAPEGDSKGKLVSICRTLRTLGWRPKYGSFEDFMAAGARDWYNEEQGAVVQGSAHA